jgi:hypothetical protein
MKPFQVAVPGLIVGSVLMLNLGCASRSKLHVLVSVVDETTGLPLPDIRVSTQYQEGNPLPRKPTSSDVLTGPDGLAMLVFRNPSEWIYIHTREGPDAYLCQTSLGLSPNSTAMLRERSPDYYPTVPDAVISVLSDMQRAKRMEVAQQERKILEREARHLFEHSPDFWPETRPNSSWVKDTLGLMLIELRWKSASKDPLGNQEDIEAIRHATLGHMKSINSKVNEIRWLSSDRVMVDASWYSTPLAAAGYSFVLYKREGQWTILVRYMNWVS